MQGSKTVWIKLTQLYGTGDIHSLYVRETMYYLDRLNILVRLFSLNSVLSAATLFSTSVFSNQTLWSNYWSKVFNLWMKFLWSLCINWMRIGTFTCMSDGILVIQDFFFVSGIQNWDELNLTSFIRNICFLTFCRAMEVWMCLHRARSMFPTLAWSVLRRPNECWSVSSQ